MFDSITMFELGYAFMNSGEANFREGVYISRSKFQNIAGVVNLAFACELFLKCLLNLSGKQLKGHRLKDLWQEYKDYSDTEATEIMRSVMKRLETDMTFDNMLQDNSNIFCNYRYFYDPKHLSEIRDNPIRSQFLRIFASSLYSFLREKLIINKEKDNI